jgi:hypothetical protein
MTEQEILTFYQEMEQWYGDALANFEHHPRQFANQIRLYRYYKERREKDSSEIPMER